MFHRSAAGAALAFLTLVNAALAGECPGKPGALGTSRVIAVDPAKYQRLGLMQYRETLPLEDHEVVLTFDDGPIAVHTAKVLDALAADCVKATFFVVGQQADAFPALVQRELREGHTIGTHTAHHRHLRRLPVDVTEKEITGGIASVNKALGSAGTSAPFFRFPYFESTDANEASALKLGLAIWSADFHASDWNRVRPEQVAGLAIERLEAKKKGILLLHDIHERTALALPLLFDELKKRGFHIVHAVPAEAVHPKTATTPEIWKATVQ